MAPNVAILNVQEIHERAVSIISGTTSSVRVNPGVQWRPNVLHYEEIASNGSVCQSLGARVIAIITHLYPTVAREPTIDESRLVSMWWAGRRGTIDGGDRYNVHMLRLRSPGTVLACRLSTGLTRY